MESVRKVLEEFENWCAQYECCFDVITKGIIVAIDNQTNKPVLRGNTWDGMSGDVTDYRWESAILNYEKELGVQSEEPSL